MDSRFARPNSYEGIYAAMLQLRVGRAIAHAVGRRLPTAAARVRAQVRSCGICGGQSGRFSPSTSVSPANSHSTDCSTIIIIYHPGLVQ
jgi:hypothetical protein